MAGAISEKVPPSEVNFKSNKDRVCAEENAFLSDIYFLMQQNKKEFYEEIEEVFSYVEKNRKSNRMN